MAALLGLTAVEFVPVGFQLLLFGLPLHRSNGPNGLDGLGFATLLGLLRALTVVLEETLVGVRLFEPVEELSRRIDLVVVLAVWVGPEFESGLLQQ